MHHSIKGDIMLLDPQSKVIITLAIVIGISISIEPFQVFLFALLLIPTTILYRPKKSVFLRIIVTLPIVILLGLIVLLVIDKNVTFDIFGFERTYTPFQFAFLNAYRFTISVAHTSVLLESERSNIVIIDALGSFRLGRALISILLLIHRISSRLQQDYNKILLAGQSKGIIDKKGISLLFFKIKILSRLLTRSLIYSETIAYTLTARGFHGNFRSTSRGWASEGVTAATIAILCSLLFVSIPFLRPPK
jgi:energy-coupling factor transporter transmembrane protein EcfT